MSWQEKIFSEVILSTRAALAWMRLRDAFPIQLIHLSRQGEIHEYKNEHNCHTILEERYHEAVQQLLAAR